MSQQGNIRENLQQGIEAARRGDKIAARRLLQQVLSYDRDNEMAWMWMASVVDTVDERRRCLERVLQINPDSDRAREALARLGVNYSEVNRPKRPARDLKDYVIPDKRVQREGLNPYLIAALVVGAIMAGVVILSVISSLQSLPPAPDTVEQTFAALNATAQPSTATPRAVVSQPTLPPTATVFTGIIVTYDREAVASLPPPFTPTATNRPTIVPPPSPTPLSPADFRVAVSEIAAGESEPNLYFMRADGGEEVQVGLTGYRQASLSPTGEQLAFLRPIVSGETSSLQLFVAPLNELETPVQITDTANSAMSRPVWSPDGAQIAFSNNSDGDNELYVIDADGDNLRQLTDNDTNDRDPVWSPDGEQLAYAGDQDSPSVLEIYVLTLEDETITRLTDASGSNSSPAWSPDGRLIAFVSDRAGVNDIYVMAADGSGSRLITDNDNRAENDSPVWSPDSRWVAFASNRDDLDEFAWYMATIDEIPRQVVRISENTREPQTLSFLPLPS